MSEVKQQRKLIGIALGAIIVIAILFFLFQGFLASSATNNNNTNSIAVLNASGDAQDVYLHALSNGTYSVNEITVKQGVLVNLHFTADPNAGCGRSLVIYGLKLPAAVSQNGKEVIIQFTPQNTGTFEYNCAMRMWSPGKLVVVP